MLAKLFGIDYMTHSLFWFPASFVNLKPGALYPYLLLSTKGCFRNAKSGLYPELSAVALGRSLNFSRLDFSYLKRRWLGWMTFDTPSDASAHRHFPFPVVLGCVTCYVYILRMFLELMFIQVF